MKTTLIKLQDKFILVSDEEIKESCYVYKHANNPLNNGIFIIPSDTDFKSFNAEKTDTSKIIAGITDLPSIDFSLSLKNCQAIERGYDLDELAKECSENASEVDIPYSNGLYYGFIKGFQIAMEILGNKKFSEEDMKIAIEIARNGSMQEQHNGYGRPTESRFVLDNLPSDEIIQSLQQTEWDVEIVQEQGKDTFGNAELTWYNPKLDADGCLILKRMQDAR